MDQRSGPCPCPWAQGGGGETGSPRPSTLSWETAVHLSLEAPPRGHLAPSTKMPRAASEVGSRIEVPGTPNPPERGPQGSPWVETRGARRLPSRRRQPCPPRARREEARRALQVRPGAGAVMASDRRGPAPPDPGAEALHPQRGTASTPARLDLSCAGSGPLEVAVPAPPSVSPRSTGVAAVSPGVLDTQPLPRGGVRGREPVSPPRVSDEWPAVLFPKPIRADPLPHRLVPSRPPAVTLVAPVSDWDSSRFRSPPPPNFTEWPCDPRFAVVFWNLLPN